MADERRVNCEKMSRLSEPARQKSVYELCMCVLNGHGPCEEGASPLAQITEPTQATRLMAADQLSALGNGTEADGDDDDDAPDDNLINSDVFIYVIVFIVIVYFLTFLYLCLKKRQREAADAESGGAGRARSVRGADADRPPTYEEVVRGAEGGDKGAEPPTYAEVLARSQQLNKPDTGPPGS